MPIIEKKEEESRKGGIPYRGKSAPIGEEEAGTS